MAGIEDTRDLDAEDRYQLTQLALNLDRISTAENRRTVDEFMDRCALSCVIGTRVNYTYALMYLDNRCTGTPYRAHDKASIQRFLAGLTTCMSPNTVKGIARNLVTFYRWLYENVPMPLSFWKAFRVRVKQEHARDMLVTEDEFERLLAATQEYPPGHGVRALRDQTILHVLRDSGMRGSELVALNHGSVSKDPQGGLWVVQPSRGKRLKTGPRPELLTRSALVLLALMTAEPGGTNDPIFRSHSDRTHGRRLTRPQVGRLITRLRREAGIEKRITPHMLRHTEATRMARAGAPEAIINKKLWTPGSKMGRVYIHMNKDDLADWSRRDAGVTASGHDASRANKLCPICAAAIPAVALKCNKCCEWVAPRPDPPNSPEPGGAMGL